MQAQQLKKECCNVSVKWQHKKADSDQNLVLLINRNVCLVFSSFKTTLSPIQSQLMG